MERGLVQKLACGARVHAWCEDRRYVRRKCTDRHCREAQWAKQRGEMAIHVWDLQTDEQWTEYVPKEASNGGNSHLQP